MNGLLRDLRHAGRALLRNKIASAVVAATVGLGICASATVFTVLDALVFKPLSGVAKQSELWNVHATATDGTTFHSVSYPTWRDLAADNRSFSGLAAFSSRIVSLGDGAEPRLGIAQLVTGNYFSVLGTRPAAGRLLTPADDAAPGREAVVVLSHHMWKERFGADPALVGRTLLINDRPFTVVGVAPTGFQGTFLGFPFDVWVPTTMAAAVGFSQSLDARDPAWLEMVGRLKPGVTPAAARANLNLLGKRLEHDFPESHRGIGFDPRPTTGFEDSLKGPAVLFFALLAALASLVLAIACANVTGILLARATARQKEIGVRLALGARRSQLVRLYLVENLLVFLVGGALGLALTFWTAPLLERFRLPTPVEIAFDFAPGFRVALFALAASAAAGLLFGLVPALSATRPGLLAVLRGGSATARPSATRLSAGFVMLQLAFSVPLLVSAGLLLRTVEHAASADPGFLVDGLSMTTVDLSILGYDPARASRFFDALVRHAASLPGVTSASFTSLVPLGPGSRAAQVSLPGRQSREDKPLSVDVAEVGETYFSTLRIPVLKGRAFGSEDGPAATPVAIVNETLAGRLWPDREAVGQTLVQGGRTVTAIGVVGNGKYRRLWEEPRPFLYLSGRQGGSLRRDVVIRGGGSPAAVAAALRRQTRALEPALAASAVLPVREYIGFSLLPQRAAGAVAAGLGAIGLVLSAIGLAGLVAWSVARRTREFGVRMAVGARPADILRLEMRRGVVLAAGGLAVGAGAALASTRLIAGLLFGVEPADPFTFCAVTLLLGSTMLAASYFPARRAANVDPVSALRSQ